MRLLNVNTMRLEQFYTKLPPYTILSHTWGDQEVTFQDLVDGKSRELEGYQKILGCCKITRQEGFEYTWIDTCCIDKSSSAELSEAINSMFKWYQASAICFAYLEDVHVCVDPTKSSHVLALGKSRWFTRGWTLQELIAPAMVIFFNSSWQEFGTKSASVWAGHISRITGIDRNCFTQGGPRVTPQSVLGTYTVAQKLSWASKRETTRIEDQAYCLMGLFDVNMPLLYGEGPKAFARLQDEIIKRSDDCSIFAWRLPHGLQLPGQPADLHGLLAPDVRCFEDQRDTRLQDLNGVSKSNAEWILPTATYQVVKNSVWLRASLLGQIDSRGDLTKTQIGHFDETYQLYRFASGQPYGPPILLRDFYSMDNVTYDRFCVFMLGCRSIQGRLGFIVRVNDQGVLHRFDPGTLVLLEDDTVPLPPADFELFELYYALPFESYNFHNRQWTVVEFSERISSEGYTCLEGIVNDTWPYEDIRTETSGRNYKLFTPTLGRDAPNILVVYEYSVGAESNNSGRHQVSAGCDVFDNPGMIQPILSFLVHRVHLQWFGEATELRKSITDTKDIVFRLRVAVPHKETLLATLEDRDTGPENETTS